jgi:hypothetical protein
VADSGFDSAGYWARRDVEKAFRVEWYRWRSEMKDLYGPTFVSVNKQLFTQRSFAAFLAKAAELQANEPEQLEAPPPPELNQVTEPAPSGEAGSNVIITDLAPGN